MRVATWKQLIVLSEFRRLIPRARETSETKTLTENFPGGFPNRRTDDAPIVTLWKNALDKTPFSDGFFKKWFFEKTGFSGSETPISVGRTPDTLQNDSSISVQKSNVSGLNDVQEYLASELSDYAREQIAIHGKVF